MTLTMEGCVEAMPSKIILMMPKNQESIKFQESRFKNNQDQDSRFKIQVKNQDSRFKNQEKTQSR